MKILIAILSCHQFSERRRAQRQTWIKYVRGAEYRFFVGKSIRHYLDTSDVVILECDDSYGTLPEKVKAVAEWALGNKYDFIFKCDDDTYIVPHRLLASGFENHDYAGFIEDRDCHERAYPFPVYPHAAGGPGYWLSQRAMRVVSQGLPDRPEEDFAVGEAVDKAGIAAFHDARYCHEDSPAVREKIARSNWLISLHKCDPQEMRRVHECVQSSVRLAD